MFTRRVYLENRKTLGDSGEVTIDINLRDVITALWVQFRGTNGMTRNFDNTMAENVEAIEVLDGSDVIYSLSGVDAFAWTASYLGRIPQQMVSEHPADVQELNALIPFGRFIGDGQFAFDPTRFINPQVRVKWNLATNNVVGLDGFVAASGRLSIIAEIMPAAPTPAGFLMAKQHYTWTTAADGIEYIDLPRDHPYVALLVRAALAAYKIPEVLTNLKLTCDVGKFIPFDLRTDDLIDLLSQSIPRLSYKHIFYVRNNDDLDFILGHREAVSICHRGGDFVMGYSNTGDGDGNFENYDTGTVYTGLVAVDALCNGFCPFDVVYIPFGLLGDPATWFPAPEFASLRLEATQGTVSGAGEVCAVQARLY